MSEGLNVYGSLNMHSCFLWRNEWMNEWIKKSKKMWTCCCTEWAAMEQTIHNPRSASYIPVNDSTITKYTGNGSWGDSSSTGSFAGKNERKSSLNPWGNDVSLSLLIYVLNQSVTLHHCRALCLGSHVFRWKSPGKDAWQDPLDSDDLLKCRRNKAKWHVTVQQLVKGRFNV